VKFLEKKLGPKISKWCCSGNNNNVWPCKQQARWRMELKYAGKSPMRLPGARWLNKIVEYI
jgi:hypothetical protein